MNFNSVLTFDLTATGNGLTDTQTIFGSYGATIYATTNHLYVVTGHYSTGTGDTAGTVVQRFDITGDHVVAGPAGFVPGLIHGQFDLDESDGYLRIATTVPTGNTQSTAIYVLQQMAQVGHRRPLEGLARAGLSAIRFGQ